MKRRELTKELLKVCKEFLFHGDRGFAYYSLKRGYWDNWYIPLREVFFDDEYLLERIEWHPDKCHGICVRLKHKDFEKKKFSPTCFKTLFWRSDYCQITNEQILKLIESIRNAHEKEV